MRHTYNIHRFDVVRDRYGEIVNSFADLDVAVARADAMHAVKGEAFAVVRDSLVTVHVVRGIETEL